MRLMRRDPREPVARRKTPPRRRIMIQTSTGAEVIEVLCFDYDRRLILAVVESGGQHSCGEYSLSEIRCYDGALPSDLESLALTTIRDGELGYKAA
jgi:hypothetical protein